MASPSWLALCSETHHAHGNLGVHATCRPCHAIASNHRHSQQAGALPTPMGLVGISSQLCTQVNCICDRLGHMTTVTPHCHWTKFSPPKKFQFDSHGDSSNTKPFTVCTIIVYHAGATLKFELARFYLGNLEWWLINLAWPCPL